MPPWPYILKRNQAGYLAVDIVDQKQGVWFYKLKIKPKYAYIRLEILYGTYLSIKSVQMDIKKTL